MRTDGICHDGRHHYRDHPDAVISSRFIRHMVQNPAREESEMTRTLKNAAPKNTPLVYTE